MSIIFLTVMSAGLQAEGRLSSSDTVFWTAPPVDVTVSAGMTSSSAFGSSYFVAPSFVKQINPRFKLAFGARYTRFYLKPLAFTVDSRPESHHASSVKVWAEGTYQLNDKWFISAYAMKDMGADFVKQQSLFYTPVEAYGVAVDYIPSDRVRFRAEFSYTRGYGRPWFNPYDRWYPGPYGYQGGYGWSAPGMYPNGLW